MAERKGVMDNDRLVLQTLALPLISHMALGSHFTSESYILICKMELMIPNPKGCENLK